MHILLVSHGGLSTGALEAYRMFAAQSTNVSALGLSEEEGVDAFRQRLSGHMNKLLNAGEVLILADLRGGTPFNESLPFLLEHPEHVRVVTGLNLPMLVEAGMTMESGGDLETVYHAALTAGAEGVDGIDAV